ncbi:RcnB family protein [Acinetobacter sp. MB5]|uniref:RcnB family protein n=1 Tax=Acinetobacter sp. MB5 TaxID=2069438 RepID=UPI000DD06409|nr:RcnB family protein [Acinetobacter sp. MB5]
MFTKKLFAVTALSVAMLGSSMATMAAPYDDHSDRDAGGYSSQHMNDRDHHDARPSQDWQRGQPLPHGYDNGRYQVDDWRGRGLPEPPRGHRWMYINGEYVLTAIATGVISAILLGAIYGPGHDGR